MADQDELERQANRLDLVSRWADDLAHEIKNPLHAMVINLELVKRRAGGADPAPLIERAEVVESELHRVHALVDSLLRLVRPWPDTATADVDEVFQALLPVFRARARIRKVEYAHQAGGSIAAVSPGNLALVLVNLVDAAIEATPEDGRVTTSCETDDESIRVIVTDSRPGTPPGPVADGGVVGLGLAVAHRLARRSGGSLAVRPVDGGGARAVLTLRRSGAGPTAGPGSA